jgi:hypothetical protein
MRNLFATRAMRLVLTFTAALLTACASAPKAPDVDYKHDYEFSRIKTFSYMTDSGGASGNSSRAFLSDMEINRINSALIDAMELKGYKWVDDAFQADVLVNWHLFAQDKQKVSTYNTGPSYGAGYGGGYRGYNRASMYNCWNCGGTEVRVSNYTEGTFIVDIIDPKINQSVWRAVIQSKLKKQPNTDQQATNAAAQRIMAAFPPY